MNTKPTLLYYFAHLYLRDIVQDHLAFFGSVLRLGSQPFEKVLKQTFETLKNYDLSETDISLKDEDFSTLVATLGEKKIPLLIIRLPKPRNTAEASYIGVVLGNPVRYFTLELHVPDEIEKQINPNAQINYRLAEWDKKVHKLLTEKLSEPDPVKFSTAIEKLVNSV